MVSIKDVSGGNGSKRPLLCSYDEEENGDDDFEDFFHQSDKKRRLTFQQAEFLEKCFEIDSKLEHEKKIQLAKDLGLHPRQVAVWFQNRRVRWKTQQQEKEFKALQSGYYNLLADHDRLLREIARLEAEKVDLRGKVFLVEKLVRAQYKTSNIYAGPITVPASFGLKLGYLSSARSHVIDPNSPHYVAASASHSAIGEFPDHSDVSQDGAAADYLRKKTLLPSNDFFCKPGDIEDQDSRASSCNYVLSGEDHATLFCPH